MFHMLPYTVARADGFLKSQCCELATFVWASSLSVGSFLDIVTSLTFTHQQLVIIEEAHWTFTSEAANHIDTHSIFTDPWDLPAFVDIWKQSSHE